MRTRPTIQQRARRFIRRNWASDVPADMLDAYLAAYEKTLAGVMLHNAIAARDCVRAFLQAIL